MRVQYLLYLFLTHISFMIIIIILIWRCMASSSSQIVNLNWNERKNKQYTHETIRAYTQLHIWQWLLWFIMIHDDSNNDNIEIWYMTVKNNDEKIYHTNVTAVDCAATFTFWFVPLTNLRRIYRISLAKQWQWQRKECKIQKPSVCSFDRCRCVFAFAIRK